jgi:putative nucleotidyltransferase with HDIG domain
LGALNIYSGDPGAFDDEEVRLLSELASDTAYGMISLRTRTRHVEAEAKVRQTVEQLKESLEQTVRAIAATVEQRDPYTAGHQRRVASLAAAIAKELGLADNEIEGIYVAGVIHDLGKIHIPAEILSKPARLNEIEYGLIKTHPQVGCEIIKNIHFPWPVAEMVLQHHERIDGSGYPKGLVNGQIVLGARILAVADVVEAMASHRPYRPGLGPDRALDEIERNAGVTYDPDVARACLDLFHQKRFAFDYGET